MFDVFFGSFCRRALDAVRLQNEQVLFSIRSFNCFLIQFLLGSMWIRCDATSVKGFHRRHRRRFFKGATSNFNGTYFVQGIKRLFLVRRRLTRALLFPRMICHLHRRCPYRPNARYAFTARNRINRGFSRTVIRCIVNHVSVTHVTMACHRRLLKMRNMWFLSNKVLSYPTTLGRFCLVFRYRYSFCKHLFTSFID